MRYVAVFVLVMVCTNLNAETKTSTSSDVDKAFASMDMLEKDKYYRAGELYGKAKNYLLAKELQGTGTKKGLTPDMIFDGFEYSDMLLAIWTL